MHNMVIIKGGVFNGDTYHCSMLKKSYLPMLGFDSGLLAKDRINANHNTVDWEIFARILFS